MSEVTASFFNCKISKELKKKNSFVVQSYQMSEKNRPQVVNKTWKIKDILSTRWKEENAIFVFGLKIYVKKYI